MAPRARKANLFEVSGGATSVTYSTTSITGQPQFHYSDAKYDVNIQGADNIRSKKTEQGTLVTIDVDGVEDGPTVTATLVVPTVNMGDSRERKLRTIVLLTTSANTIGGPGLVEGQVQTYKSTAVRGTAKAVDS
ncbi:MAG: hypothetical protein QOE93_1870 [Actinomycetota bacterium]|jgi:hypothetical protein|nr:hypothetical protein [Actinomycetota bacterium]